MWQVDKGAWRGLPDLLFEEVAPDDATASRWRLAATNPWLVAWQATEEERLVEESQAEVGRKGRVA